MVGAACLWGLAWTGLSAPEPLSPNSIYHLEGSWKDQQGQPFQLRQLRGQIRVLAIICTSTESVGDLTTHFIGSSQVFAAGWVM